jgi:hypothetical protein
MYHGDLWQQEQVQHRDDDSDSGESGDQYGDQGQYGDSGGHDDSGYGYAAYGDDDSSGGADSASQVYYGFCDVDHAQWIGPNRSSRDDAQADCDAHNNSRHGGSQYATVYGGA